MLASSLFFYGWWHHDRDDWTFIGSWLPRYVVYLLIFAAVNHALAQLAGRMRHRRANTKPVVLAACVFDLGGLFYFKYFEWARGVSNDWLHTDLRPTNVILPIAVSFIAFQALGYVIDVHRGTIEPIDSLDFFTYLFFFPHLAAGPLVRVGEFEPQMRQRGADPRSVDASRAFLLIASGFVKKVIVSFADLQLDRQGRLRQPDRLQRARQPVRHLRLRRADLLRLLGLLGHGHRRRADARLPLPHNFDSPLLRRSRSPSSGAAGTSRSPVVARLPLHPPGRQPRRRRCAPT